MTLRAKLLEVLDIGGPRKRTILKALALHLGFTEAQFDKTIAALKRDRAIKPCYQYGGQRIGLAKQRGFAIPQLMIGVIVVAILTGAFFTGYRAGLNSERAAQQEQKLGAIAAGQARAADVSDAIKEGQDQAAAAAGRAAGNDEKNKEALREARRNRVVLASCPAAVVRAAPPVVGEQPVGSGLRAPGVPGGGDPGIRLRWRYVGLHDAAFTGGDGKPVFRIASQYALAPERADTDSPYGLDDAVEVAGENARAFSACLRSFEQAISALDAAEAAWGKGP